MDSIKDKRHGQVMAILVIGLSIACIYQMFEIHKLKSQLKSQAETIEHYANRLFERSRDLYNLKQSQK